MSRAGRSIQNRSIPVRFKAVAHAICTSAARKASPRMLSSSSFARRSKPERCECPNRNANEIERFAMRQLADLRADSHLITSILSRLPDETSETVVAAVKNIDKLTDYCDPELMKELYSHVFEEIVFDWRGEKIDIKFKKD